VISPQKHRSFTVKTPQLHRDFTVKTPQNHGEPTVNPRCSYGESTVFLRCFSRSPRPVAGPITPPAATAPAAVAVA